MENNRLYRRFRKVRRDMDYKIVQATILFNDVVKAMAKLEKQVNELIKDGWKPLGGISFVIGGTLIQAMIKKEPEDKVEAARVGIRRLRAMVS